MGLSAKQHLILIIAIIFDFPSEMGAVPRVTGSNRDRHGSVAKQNKNKAPKDTCVSGYCLDPAYNKLELPPTMPAHVRINLEVNVQRF